jgi:hypothetical protein
MEMEYPGNPSPQRQLDYRANPNAAGDDLREGCDGYDQPNAAPAVTAHPQLNMQDWAPADEVRRAPLIYTPIVDGTSQDYHAALAFERAITGAPKPYPEEPGFLRIDDPRSMG